MISMKSPLKKGLSAFSIAREKTSPIADSTLSILEERDKQIREIAHLRNELEEIRVRNQYKKSSYEDSVSTYSAKSSYAKDLPKPADPENTNSILMAKHDTSDDEVIEELMNRYNIKRGEISNRMHKKEAEMERYIDNFIKKQKENKKPSHGTSKSIIDEPALKLKEANKAMKVEINKLTSLLDKSKEKNGMLESELAELKAELASKEQLLTQKPLHNISHTYEKQLEKEGPDGDRKSKEVDEIYMGKALNEIIGVGEPFLSTESMTLKEKLECIRSLVEAKKQMAADRKVAKPFAENTSRVNKLPFKKAKDITEEKTLKVKNELKTSREMKVTDIERLSSKVTALEERMQELECKTVRLNEKRISF
eukprot:TRINITY_DN1816_c0_g1_i10.p1 TRINITY_DN1816_c0_g1~~TRINITY_DN1816_c0_g1_i10.p1  ORF type:complete len:367 (+),score=99.97 TRINITY_DN1816_c0_g1_i10:95-1195(+)